MDPAPIRVPDAASPARILWLAKGLGRGGAERLIVESVHHLQAHRFHVEVAYLLPWKDAFVPELEAMGVPVHCLGATKVALDPRWVWRLRRLVRERRFDLVHTHMPVPAVGARLVLPRTPAMVHTEHNLWDRYRPATRWANALTFGRNAAAIAVSEAVADSIRPPKFVPHPPPVHVVLHGPRLAAIPSGPAAREEGRARLSLSPDEQVVGTVGNFTPKKNQRMLLDAVARIAAPANVKIVLVGLGPLREELEAHARSLGLESRVTFTGLRSDVYELLPAFDVFALSSNFEGLPIALLEAMGAGLPSVATSVGGIPEVITDADEGFLVGADDTEAFANRLEKLLADPLLRSSMGARAQRRAGAFDLGSAVACTELIYDEALGRA